MTDPEVKALARRIYASEERISALARARQLTSSSIPVNIGGEQVDIPLTVGVSQAVKAREELEVAKAELEAALESARAEIEAAEGRLAETEQKVAVAEQQISEMLVDLDTAMEDAANAQVEAVLARGLLTVSTSAPVAADGQGKPLGAMWMHRSGNALTALYEWTSLGWVPRPLSETIIPKIAIGEGTYGLMSGQRLEAGSVTTTKLLVGDTSNLAELNESYEDSVSYSGWSSKIVEGWSVRSSNTANAYFMFRNQKGPIPFKAGDQIRVTGTAISDVNVSARVTLWTYPAGTGSAISSPGFTIGTTPTPFDVTFTIPESMDLATKSTFLVGLNDVLNRDVRVKDVRVRVMNAGELLVDGSVGARHVATGTLQALAATITEAWIQSGHIVNLDVSKLVASSATLSSAVIEKLWADVVKAKFLTVTEKIITQDVIATGAIDGMTITGALIRTAATGQRLEFGFTGLSAYNTLGNVVASLSSSGGSMTLTGGLDLYFPSTLGGARAGSIGYSGLTYGTGTPTSLSLDKSMGLSLTAPANTSTNYPKADSNVDARGFSVASYHSTGAEKSRAWLVSGAGQGAELTLRTRANPSAQTQEFRAIADSSTGQGFIFQIDEQPVPAMRLRSNGVEFPQQVTFGSDTDWQPLPLASGWMWDTLGKQPAYRVRLGKLYVRGRIKRVDGSDIGADFTTGTFAPAGAIPALPGVRGNDPSSTPGGRVNSEALVRILSDGSMQGAAPAGVKMLYITSEYLID